MKIAFLTWREDACGAGAVGVMAVAAWLLVLRPGADARDQAADLRVQTDLVHSQVAMVQAQARSAHADLVDTTGRLGPSRPLRPVGEFNRVLATLNQAAVEVGLTLDQIMPGESDQSEGIERQRISVSGRGSYQGAIAFLETLRDRFPDVTVLAFSATRGPADSSGEATVSLELAWHAQPDAPGASKRH